MAQVQFAPEAVDAAAAASRRVRRNVRNGIVAVLAIAAAQGVISFVTPEGMLAETAWVLAQFARLIAFSVLLGAILMGLWSASTVNGVRLFADPFDQSRPVRRADDLGRAPRARGPRGRGTDRPARRTSTASGR